MKLTRKLTLAIALGVVLVLGVAGYLQIRREVALFERDGTRDHQVLATKLAETVAEVRRLEGDPIAADVIEHASHPGSALHIHWVRFQESGPGDRPLVPDAARRALSTLREVQTVDHRGTGMLVTYHPLLGGPPALIELSESLSEQRAYTRVTLFNVAATTMTAGMVCILMAYVLGASIVGAPVRQLVDKARRVGRGDLASPLVLRADDELGLLAHEMNVMCENLSAATAKADAEAAARMSALEQLRHADRLATVGKLAAGIAHELGTPLNVVAGRAKMIENSQVMTQETRGSARVIAEQTERMSAIIRQLLDFARQSGSQTGSVDLLQLAREAVKLLSPLGQKRQVQVQISPKSYSAKAIVSRSHMLQAVMNLIVNAIHASAERSFVDVQVSQAEEPAEQRHDANGPFATITVTDYGKGMTREVVDHAFEPFFTTKGVGEGTGLGLSVTYGIVSDHGGFITVSSSPGRGSEFRIYLPLAGRDSQPMSSTTIKLAPLGPRALNPAHSR